MQAVTQLHRYTKPSDLRDKLIELIAQDGSTITNKNLIEKNQRELAMLETELRRYGILNPRQKWYGSAINVLPTLEKVLNGLGYATKVVRRERNGRQCKEVVFNGNPAFDIDAQTLLIRAKALADEIQDLMDKQEQKMIVLRQILKI